MVFTPGRSVLLVDAALSPMCIDAAHEFDLA